MPASDIAPPRHRLSLLGGTTDRTDVALALRGVLRRQGRIDGPAIAAFEDACAAAAAARHGVSFATGRLALTAILEALDVGPGDEVLVPVPTHVVVPNAVRAAGASPVFVDSDPRTLNVDLHRVRERVGPRTRVLLVQHTFGIPVDMDEALAVSRTHGLHLVEDCVHALGATWRGAPVGSLGRAGFTSTEETKVISTTLGGVAFTDDAELAERLRTAADHCRWPSHGMVQRRMVKLIAYHLLTWPPIHRPARAVYEAGGRRHPLPVPVTAAESAGRVPAGYRERMSAAQAAVGLHQLERLQENLAHRRQIARIYADALPDACRVHVPDGAGPTWVRYPILVGDRVDAVAALAPWSVVGTWFSSVLEESVSPRVAGYVDGSCPAAEVLARHLVNLPTHQRVTEEDARRIGERAAAVAVPWEELAWATS